MVNQRLNGGFGPSRRPSPRVCKPTKTKPRSKLMKKCLKEVKITRQYYMVSMPKRHNNVNVPQDRGKARKMPQTPLERPPSGRLKNGLFSSPKKNESRASSSGLYNGASYLARNTEKSRDSPRPNNGSSRSKDGSSSLAKKMERSRASSIGVNIGASSLSRNTKKSRAFPCPNNGSSRPKKTEKFRTSSSRPNNGATSLGKNTEKSRASFSWANNGTMSSAKDAEKSRPCSSRRKDNVTSSVNNIEKSRPSRFSDGLPLGKDDSNFTLRVTKKALPLTLVMSAHMTKNVDANDQCNNLGSMSKGLLDSNQGKGIVAIFEVSKFSKSKVVSTSTDLTMVDKNKCNRVDLSFVEMAMGGEVRKEDLCKSMEAPSSSLALRSSQVGQDVQHISGNNSFPIAKELSSHQLTEESPKGCIDLGSKNTSLEKDDLISDDELKRKRLVGLLVEKPTTHDDDSEQVVRCRPSKKRRKYIDNEYEEDDGNDQNLAAVEGVTAGLTTQTAIDEPIWSGIFKIGRKEYVSMAAHSSPKSCEKVWEFSRSLQPVVEVTKLSRWEAWPKGFLASKPTDDNNALYFLPLEMRPNGDMDTLVKEVMENDMVLRAVVGEAEMLIVPSILLPEQPQTFKSKPYLLGVFRPREDNIDVVEEHRGTGCCAREEEMGNHDVSQQHVVKEGTRVAGLNMDCGIQAPEQVERQHIEKEPTPSLAGLNAPNPAEGAAEPTPAPTTAAAMSANHVQINSSLEVPTGAVFAFVAGETPKLKELIQELKRDGGLVVAMRGEMIGSGLLPDNSDRVGRRTSGLGSSMVYGDPRS